MQSAGNPQASEEDANRPDWDGVDRRAGDRRDEPTRLFGGWLTPRRRAGGRRDSDRAGYVDRYTRRDVALLLTVFLLNVFDAWMTMQWLSRGGREANPVMDFFLDISPTAFLVQKCLVVGFWLLILVAHKNFRFARIGLYASLVVYALLMLLHFSIVLLGIEPPTEASIEAEATTTTRYSMEADTEAVTRYGMEADAPSAIMETAGRPAAE